MVWTVLNFGIIMSLRFLKESKGRVTFHSLLFTFIHFESFAKINKDLKISDPGRVNLSYKAILLFDWQEDSKDFKKVCLISHNFFSPNSLRKIKQFFRFNWGWVLFSECLRDWLVPSSGLLLYSS